MHLKLSSKQFRAGSALVTVLAIGAVTGIVITGMLTLSSTSFR